MVAAADSEENEVDDLLEGKSFSAEEEHGNENQVKNQEKNMTPESPQEPWTEQMCHVDWVAVLNLNSFIVS